MSIGAGITPQRAKVLVVGGAGYVGSATCAWLIDHGYEVWILDDLSTGHFEHVRALLPKGLLETRFIHSRAGNHKVVPALLGRERFDCLLHFAARTLVSESFAKPEEYYENNVIQTGELLNAMLAAGTRSFIFSSTCSIFGNPGSAAIHETLPKQPDSPYGATKLEVERLMETLSKGGQGDRGLNAISLRYFNAAGAEPGVRVGEWHFPESHLIPSILQAIMAGRPIEIFGTDYPTPDGTCIRDYVDVSDLAAAHEAALVRLLEVPHRRPFEAFNLGSGTGFSVREVIDTCFKVTGSKVGIVESQRRPGDPPRLVADSGLAQRALGFKPVRTLEEMARTAWQWECKRTEVIGTMKKAVFLDRDGTLNEDPGYIGNPDQLKLLPGVTDALSRLQKAGYLLVVVSNQSGVGRGMFTMETLQHVHERLDQLLAASSVKIDHYELCIHRPEDECDCRKPKPKLILDAARKFRIDLTRSFMIGDKLSDLGTGRSAGCQGVALVRTGEGKTTESKMNGTQADYVGNSLEDVAAWILNRR